MHLKSKLPLLCLIILTGCGLGIKTIVKENYPPLNAQQEVRVLDILQPFPTGAVEVGKVRIYDNGTTIRCDSATVFNAAKDEARKAGGNVLKVLEHTYPNFLSSCHQ